MEYNGPITRARARRMAEAANFVEIVEDSDMQSRFESHEEVIPQNSNASEASAAPVVSYDGPITRARARSLATEANENNASNDRSNSFSSLQDALLSPFSPNHLLSHATTQRLMAELRGVVFNPPDLCAACVISEHNLLEWEASIIGPPGSPYENGFFKLKVNFSPNHPNSPPSITFVTPIFHCNISTCGMICMDMLSENWTPTLTISIILQLIQTLLIEPNADDALNGEASYYYLSDRALHDETAREWTRLFAKRRE